MPYVRVGKCVYRQNEDGSRGDLKGCSKTEREAKRYMAALYVHETKEAGDSALNDWGLSDEQATSKGNLRTLMVGKLHHAMTTVTDLLTQQGYLSQEQNKVLTALKGELLQKFNSEVPEELASMSITPEHLS